MDDRLTVLKLYVQELGEQGDITSFDSRKRLQKTVYLGQLSGVDIGYRYGWYIKGPYSTGLTQDYYALAEAVAQGDNEFKQKSLNQAVREKLAKIKDVFNVPAEVPLDKASWLELLASWHFLNVVSKKNRTDAVSVMQTQKPALAGYIDVAENVLKKFNLM